MFEWVEEEEEEEEEGGWDWRVEDHTAMTIYRRIN